MKKITAADKLQHILSTKRPIVNALIYDEDHWCSNIKDAWDIAVARSFDIVFPSLSSNRIAYKGSRELLNDNTIILTRDKMVTDGKVTFTIAKPRTPDNNGPVYEHNGFFKDLTPHTLAVMQDIVEGEYMRPKYPKELDTFSSKQCRAWAELPENERAAYVAQIQQARTDAREEASIKGTAQCLGLTVRQCRIWLLLPEDEQDISLKDINAYPWEEKRKVFWSARDYLQEADRVKEIETAFHEVVICLFDATTTFPIIRWHDAPFDGDQEVTIRPFIGLVKVDGKFALRKAFSQRVISAFAAASIISSTMPLPAIASPEPLQLRSANPLFDPDVFELPIKESFMNHPNPFYQISTHPSLLGWERLMVRKLSSQEDAEIPSRAALFTDCHIGDNRHGASNASVDACVAFMLGSVSPMSMLSPERRAMVGNHIQPRRPLSASDEKSVPKEPVEPIEPVDDSDDDDDENEDMSKKAPYPFNPFSPFN